MDINNILYLSSVLLCIPSFCAGAFDQLMHGNFYTPQFTLTVAYYHINQNINITCRGRLYAEDMMIFQKQSKTAGLVLTNGVDSVLVRPKMPEFSAVVSEISSENPPFVNVTMIYTLTGVSRSDAGIYKCELGDDSVTYNLTVAGPPYGIELSSSSQDVYIHRISIHDVDKYPVSQAMYEVKVKADENIDDSVVLIAKFLSIPEPSKITWLEQRNDSQGWEQNNRRSIELERELELDGKEYLLTAANEFGTYNVTIIFRIEYKPRPPAIGQRIWYPLEGDIVITKCKFSAQPPAQVFYVKENRENGEWERLDHATLEDGTLRLEDINLDRDVGMYRCFGENKHGSSNGTIFINGEPKMVDFDIENTYAREVDLILRASSSTNVEFIVNVTSQVEQGTKTVVNSTSSSNADSTVPDIEKRYIVSKLSPNTDYVIYVTAKNKYGAISSELKLVTTEEDGFTRPPKIQTSTETIKSLLSDTGSAQRLVGAISLLIACLVIHL